MNSGAPIELIFENDKAIRFPGGRGHTGKVIPATAGAPVQAPPPSLQRSSPTENSMLRMAIENMSQGLCMFDRMGLLVVCNGRYARMYGLNESDVLPGTPIAQVLRRRIAAGVVTSAKAEDYIDHVLTRIASSTSNCRFTEQVGGRTIVVEFQPFADGGWVATHEDITERIEMQAQLNQHALRDPLTLLPNRVKLQADLNNAPVEDCIPGMALLCIDLDRFREVNRELGHACADALIKEAAGRLVASVRMNDIVARTGGDQFSVLCRQIVPGDEVEIAARLLQQLSAPFTFAGQEFCLGASIGIAVAIASGKEHLVQQAETALRYAKTEAPGSYRYYEAAMLSRADRTRQLTHDVRRAMARGELEVAYQPIFDACRKTVVACEALLRWNHPVLGSVMPDHFIPLLEDMGLIGPIGEWVLQQATRECANWPAHVRVAVNISASQFKRRAIVPAVTRALSEAGLAPNRLELEVTETAALLANADTRTSMHELRTLGVQLAMDDFGTGYSSLCHMHDFPFDRIKIDRCFLRNGDGGKGSRRMLEAIFAMARTLAMATTMEGIETQDQARMVQTMGCREMQGFALGKPMPPAQLRELLARQPRHGQAGLGVAGVIALQ